MNNKELLGHIRLFREKSNSNKLIIFVGAGVSQNVKDMPSWHQLIQEMAKSIDYNKCTFCKYQAPKCSETCRFKDVFSQDEFLKIPQYVYNRDPGLYTKIIAENISGVEKDVPLSNAIFSLNPAHIITTNYDKLIESCKSVQRDNYDVIVFDRDLLVSEKTKYIIKMHGDIERLETIILKEADYLDYSQKHVLIEMFVKALLSDHTILFLGYSLNDYNIKLIINWINYIRSQNDALLPDTKIGYIALDSEQIAATEIDYFKNNNIGVINLREMPLIDNMPGELTQKVGQRLYSFLSVISNMSYEKYLGISLLYDDAVRRMKNYRFVDGTYICKSLYLGSYMRNGTELTLHSDSSYDELISYMKSNSDNATELKKLFVNAGITIIELHSLGTPHRREKYSIDCKNDSLLENSYYKLYAHNRYHELLQMCNLANQEEWRESSFYKTLILDYAQDVFEKYRDIEVSKLSVEQKIAYLFNSAVLKSKQTFSFSSREVQQYIENLPDQHMRSAFQPYLDIFEGNTRRLLLMKESLTKLKEQYESNHTFVGTSSLGELYKIKRFAIEQYRFYFCNNLLYVGFSDLKNILKIYAEAIICTNGEYDVPRKSVWGKASPKEKYPIELTDFDILTKMISTKDLYEFFEVYRVNKLKIDSDTVDACIDSFVNMARSISELRLFSPYLPNAYVLINNALCLSYVDLTAAQKSKLSEAITKLLCNLEFSNYFFSVNYPEWRKSLTVLYNFLMHISFQPNQLILKTFFQNTRLLDYAVNVNLYTLQKVVACFVDKSESSEDQRLIKEFILSCPEKTRSKVIRIMKSAITDEVEINNSKEFISKNFESLQSDDIIDFSFSGWLKLSEDNARAIIEKTLEIKKAQTSGVVSFPDPLETQLELVCLLYITNAIDDISLLKPLAAENDYLRFFFDDPTFEYSKISFKDYMWENIARTPKYTEKLKVHAEEIIPRLQREIEVDSATEFERKLLYGVLLDNVF